MAVNKYQSIVSIYLSFVGHALKRRCSGRLLNGRLLNNDNSRIRNRFLLVSFVVIMMIPQRSAGRKEGTIGRSTVGAIGTVCVSHSAIR